MSLALNDGLAGPSITKTTNNNDAVTTVCVCTCLGEVN